MGFSPQSGAWGSSKWGWMSPSGAMSPRSGAGCPHSGSRIYFTLFLTLWNTHTKTPKHVQGRQKRRRKEKSCTEEWREAVLPPGSSARARRVLLRRGGSRNALPRGQRGHHTVPRDGHESWAPATRVVPVHSQRGQSVRPPALGYPAGSCGPVPAPRTLPAQEGRTQQL